MAKKQIYLAPVAEVMNCRIERGYAGSITTDYRNSKLEDLIDMGNIDELF